MLYLFISSIHHSSVTTIWQLNAILHHGDIVGVLHYVFRCLKQPMLTRPVPIQMETTSSQMVKYHQCTNQMQDI